MNLSDADTAITRALRALPHHRTTDRALAAASRATDHGVGWLCVGVAGGLVRPSRASAWARGAVTAWAAHQVSDRIKRLWPRSRPAFAGLPPLASVPSPLSFPSSHTCAAVAAIRGFDGAVPRPALRAGATVIAFSRPYLGVHYVGDVLAGALVGAAVGRLVARTT